MNRRVSSLATLGIISLVCTSMLATAPFAFSKNATDKSKDIQGQSDFEESFGTVQEPTSQSGPAPRGGMASEQVFSRTAALNIFDHILGYKPPIGPQIDFRLNYNYLEATSDQKHKDSPNLGAGWTLNWVSSLRVDSKGNVTVAVPGGGSEYYAINKKQGTNLYSNNLMSHALLVADPEGSFERQLPDGTVEVYGLADDVGRIHLTQIKDRAGNAARIGYDKWYRAVAIVDALGQVSKIRYASQLPNNAAFYRISELEDPFGRKARLNYDKDFKHLQSSTDAIGISSRFTYAENSNSIVQLNTPYGATKYAHYRPGGSPVGSLGLKITFADGSSTVTEHWTGNQHATYEWGRLATNLYPSDPSNSIYTHCKITKWLTKPNGKELSVKASVKEPLESEVIYSYPGQLQNGFNGESNLPTSISRRVQTAKPDGTTGSAIQTYRYEYNRFGKVTKSVDPVGRTLMYRFAPNDLDLIEVHQARAGNDVLLSKFEYDDKHNRVSAKDLTGNETKYQYNKYGQLIKTTAANNSQVSSVYDQRGFLTTLIGPLGPNDVLGKLEYDQVGRLKSLTNVDGQKVSFEYDNADRLIKRTFEDGSGELIGYDKLNPVSFTDRAGRKSSRTFDVLGRISSETDPLGRQNKYEWCLCGALAAFVDPVGNKTQWHHDIQGRLIQKRLANGTEITFEYEKEGRRLLARTDALKQRTIYHYFLDNAVSDVRYENALNTTSAVKYTRHPDYPLLQTATSDFGEIKLEYNEVNGRPGAGFLKSIENSGIPKSKISFEYDFAGRIIRQGLDDNTDTRTFDEAGRLVTEENALGQFEYKYDNKHNSLSGISYPNGIVAEFSITNNRDGILQSITGKKQQTLYDFNYFYDKIGHLTKFQEKLSENPIQENSASYDLAGQLIDAISQSENNHSRKYHYEYDKASNRILARTDRFVQESKFNQVNELTSISSTTTPVSGEQGTGQNLSYDANGNLIDDGEKKYKWDAENRLVRIEYNNTDRATEFSYDALGQRAKITELEAGKAQNARYYVWCEGTIREERDTAGNATKCYFPLGEKIGADKYYFSLDNLGSTRVITNSNGEVAATLSYDPFGQPLNAALDLYPDFQFTGIFTHKPSRLNLTKFRAYDSKIGRWLSRDPIGEFGTNGEPANPANGSMTLIANANLYSYCSNTPLQRIDLLGLEDFDLGKTVQQGWDNLMNMFQGGPPPANSGERGDLNNVNFTTQVNHTQNASGGTTQSYITPEVQITGVRQGNSLSAGFGHSYAPAESSTVSTSTYPTGPQNSLLQPSASRVSSQNMQQLNAIEGKNANSVDLSGCRRENIYH